MKKFKKEFKKFDKLTFEDFEKLAKSEGLSDYEKIGFPDQYREEYDQLIFEDIVSKLDACKMKGTKILDIGSGCSPIVDFFHENAKKNNQQYFINDSKEMIKKYENDNNLIKVEGRFPECIDDNFFKSDKKFNAIIIYSVLQYVTHSNLYQFLDQAVELLADGGKILIGDIPNLSMKNRFLKSEKGINFHKEYTGEDSLPQINTDFTQSFEIDDGILLGILMRYRNSGHNAYIVPQSSNLPMANRREDIIIERI